jgi:hypothetical protein
MSPPPQPKSMVFLEGPHALPVFPYDKMKLWVERWWNDTPRGKPKFLDENVNQCHFSSNIPHTGLKYCNINYTQRSSPYLAVSTVCFR